ncbi:TetR/AcrR family transcriptional regulator [Novosphingobium album (ex Liu et al. 2023)]|uniref:Helix-turn-helix domain containing protein n=1 Tax=Novosphingobium album (ex Liu et al. 2023) TaxID=3031130 RepID=A0ABT5WR76_9SPHN|nr:TetR/AcrR family transcriptional regulator [Novosphingobium album (ex Liu et al. 2023)]MDE8652241.1 helix-turn-helix domain containing protein [Novosphingobium album (ex Liu et al. 2023)]
MIDTAVRLVSEKGIEALSLAEVAREAGLNRTTLYYHFASRDALIAAVREWSAHQLAKAFAPVESQAGRARYITRFVLENPQVIALWTEDFLSPGDIRDRYPEWDGLVAGLGAQLRAHPETRDVDAEVYGTIMLAAAMIAPRIYRQSVRPDLAIDEAIERFTAEQMRTLKRDGIGG